MPPCPANSADWAAKKRVFRARCGSFTTGPRVWATRLSRTSVGEKVVALWGASRRDRAALTMGRYTGRRHRSRRHRRGCRWFHRAAWTANESEWKRRAAQPDGESVPYGREYIEGQRIRKAWSFRANGRTVPVAVARILGRCLAVVWAWEAPAAPPGRRRGSRRMHRRGTTRLPRPDNYTPGRVLSRRS